MSTLARIAVMTGLFPALIFACLWDSDTIRDEIQARPSLFELVTGHLPHHGTAYYEARVDRLEPKRDRSREETNDLAVALIRLGRFDEAAAIVIAQQARHLTHVSYVSPASPAPAASSAASAQHLRAVA